MADSSTDVRDLARDLRLATGRLARRLRRMFVDGGEGLAFLELGVLHRLARSGSTSPGALAGDEGVTGAAVAAALTRMDTLGFVERSKDPEDGRRVVVTVTDAGLRSLESRDAAVIARIHEVLQDHLDAGERAQLAAVLPLLEKVAAHL
jgi:DNA-binding MarR family transcriptional regulator